LNKPFPTYNGGKEASGVYQAIINQIPPHDVYIEGCLGNGAIFRKKSLAPGSSIGLDKDGDVIRKWESMKPEPCIRLYKKDLLKYLEFLFTSPLNNRLTFIYIDPPYLRSTRRGQKDLYKHEMEFKRHQLMLALCRSLECNIAISSYKNKLYDALLSDWRRIDFPSSTRNGQAIESLYMNYPEPQVLHDYRYLGKNFRERERIKNKTKRQLSKLSKLPVLERMALLSAINQNFK